MAVETLGLIIIFGGLAIIMLWGWWRSPRGYITMQDQKLDPQCMPAISKPLTQSKPQKVNRQIKHSPGYRWRGLEVHIQKQKKEVKK